MKIRKVRHKSVTCKGGPWHGKKLIAAPHTMVFLVGEWNGNYRNGVWYDV